MRILLVALTHRSVEPTPSIGHGNRPWVSAANRAGRWAASYSGTPEIHGETDDEENRGHQQHKEPNYFICCHAAKLTDQALRPDDQA